MVQSDFRWNVLLDDSLFDLSPPAGYEVERRQSDASFKGEQDLTRALDTWLELADGQLPHDTNDLTDEEKVLPLLIARYDKDGKPEDELNSAFEAANVLLKGLMFAQERKLEGDWYYAGDGVRAGDKDTPLCWWKSEDSGTYRVMFGDLHIADLTPEDLHQVER